MLLSDREKMVRYEFVANGPGDNQTWRCVVPPDRVIRLGRSPRNGWAIPWDMRISREHADMVLEGDRLRVRRLPTARNAIYVRGQPMEEFTIGVGEDFRIGRTLFHVELVAEEAEGARGSEPDPAIAQLAKQPPERRLESLLARIDAEEDRRAWPVPGPVREPAQERLGEAPPGQPAQGPAEGQRQSEIEALRAEVKALRAMLAMERAREAAVAHASPAVPEPAPAAPAEVQAPAAPSPAPAQPAEKSNGDRALESNLGLPVEDAAAAAVSVEMLDGAAFGNYELLDQIHRGGTGQVLKARHRHIDRLVAIKLLSGPAAESEETVLRFRRKAKFLASASHRNLVAIYDAGQLEGTEYLIMEYVDGHDLVYVLKRETLDVRRAVDYTLQAAEALQYAHARNVVHRNVNPSHLLVDSRGVVKLTGWGFALRIGDQELRAFERPGNPIGTLDYMAPEQIVDSWKVDQRADVYSLGCTLFAILTKRVVYPIDWPRRKATAQRFQPPPSLKELRADVPESLETVYRAMMAKVPENRFQTMAELIDALHEVEAEL